MMHPRTIKVYDFNWDSAYIVMDDAIWKGANARMTHSTTIKSYDYSGDGAYTVMGGAISNRLQAYTRSSPGLWKSMIIAEMVPTLSWTMLFEVVCRSTYGPLQHH